MCLWRFKCDGLDEGLIQEPCLYVYYLNCLTTHTGELFLVEVVYTMQLVAHQSIQVKSRDNAFFVAKAHTSDQAIFNFSYSFSYLPSPFILFYLSLI